MTRVTIKESTAEGSVELISISLDGQIEWAVRMLDCVMELADAALVSLRLLG